MTATADPYDCTALVALAQPRPRRRASLLALIRRPGRVTQLEALLDRYRWTNTGLRERMRDQTIALEAIEGIVNDTARILGHAHPVVVDVRRILTELDR